MKRIPLVILICAVSFISYSQQLSGDIEVYLNTLIEDIPRSNGNHYREPSEEERGTWESCLQSFLDGHLVLARQAIDELNYQIIEFQDTSQHPASNYYVFQEKPSRTNYWGTYVFTEDPLRKHLILQIPHPLYDSKTGYQGAYCFKRLSAGALFLSGTHRCNSTLESPCSGTTTACSTNSAPYRISDNAHNTNSMFQVSTEVVFRTYANSKFVQLHGFAKNDSDPYVIMSNGTRVTPEEDYVSLIRDYLSIADPGLTFKVAHIDLDWNRLIAFTNTQGRFINGSLFPCIMNATDSEGRFIHIEQERIRLRNDISGWNKMLYALSNAFQVDTATDTRLLKEEAPFAIYPNPACGYITIRTDGPSLITLYNLDGALMLSKELSGFDHRIDLSSMTSGIYLIRIENRAKIYFTKVIVL